MSVHSWSLTDILTMGSIRGVNSTMLRRFVENAESPKEVLDNPAKFTGNGKIFQQEIFSSPFKIAFDQAQKQIELCQEKNIRIITLWDENYPKSLTHILYPPTIIFVKGNLYDDNNLKSVGIVGTRRSTMYGNNITVRFVEEFVRHSLIVISGLAYGIDTVAHKTALKNNGITYAVIASGIDMLLPLSAQKTADEIVEKGGAVISEYRCGIRALPAYFPQRNRIVSGLSDLVLVMESGVKGGALITAQFAFDQNKPLYAIPGNIYAEKSQGTNRLIQKNMAAIALSPIDILDELGIDIQRNSAVSHLNISLEEEKILSALNDEPISIDDLALKVEMPSHELLAVLLTLEFGGLIRQWVGKQFTRI